MQRNKRTFNKYKILFLLMKTEEIQFLSQLVSSLEDAEKNLARSYEKRDYEKFNQAKKIMLRIQKEISEIIK